MKKQLAPLLCALLFAAVLQLSAQTQGYPGDQSLQPGTAGQNTPIDCSDPLQATSAQCSYQGPSGAGPLLRSMQNSGTGTAGYQQNYTDTENLLRETGQNPYSGANERPLPPEPLTEFQKFVASTTGEVLPIYAANRFREVPSTFAPLDLTPVPPDYTIGPDDELRIHVWGQVNFRADVRVQRSGDIYLPQVGEVHVADLPASALDEHLRAAISRVYKNFDLTVEVGQIRAIQVYVAGEARAPGVYTVSSLSTLVDALFASGGPTTSGSLRRIELRRGGTTVTVFDLYALLIHGDKSKDAPLQSGDVIYIPPVGPQVAITGSVHNPAIYELRAGETIAEALADAGGTSAVAAQQRISLERIDEHRDRHSMEIAFDQAGLATPLADGDLIQVLSILPSYEKTVILRGNIANPGRFAWHEGMKLSDLIPDKESLITRNYWWRRAQLGLPAPEFEPLQAFPEMQQPNQPLNLATLARNRTVNQSGAENAANAAGQGAPNPNSMNTPSTAQNGAIAGDLLGTSPSPGTPGTNPAGQSQLTAAQHPGTSSLAAQQQQTLTSEGTRRNEVGPIAPEIDWDYAVIERQDQKRLNTKLIPFDLGRLVLQHDPSQDLPLQPGDVVTVFSQDDIHVPIGQQTKFVRLDGEFLHAGTYTVEAGETLPELVRRAGGLTKNAYLYGSEFTRESTRAVQQSRLDEYIQTLEMQMQHGNLAASSAASSPQDLASASAAQAGEQGLLAQLRQLRATGRIVLEMKPGSQGVNSLPNITLENGDHFIVPSVPASVNVVGAVYDQNSFIYLASRRAGDYLHLAGGPNRQADQKAVFVIRADGSVVSRSAASGLWGNEFDALRMNPGDTIVVPEKGYKPSSLRGFLDWASLFSQFAFGAAAVKAVY